MSLIDAARQWWIRGYTPMAVRGKRPTARGWQAIDAEAHLAAIRTDPPPQIGLRMGTQRDGRVLIAIDVDGAAGQQTLSQLETELGTLPPTLSQRTGGGGMHHVFVWPAALAKRCPTTSSGKLGTGLDIRGERGHIVAAPSPHESGRCYELVNPDAEPSPLPPAWASRILRCHAPEPAPPPSQTQPSGTDVDAVIERARKYVERMDPAISGSGGHQATWRVAQVLVRGFALPRAQARQLLLAYNQRCQPPWSARDIEHKLTQAETKSRMPTGCLRDVKRNRQWDQTWDSEPEKQVEKREVKPKEVTRLGPRKPLTAATGPECPLDWLHPIVRAMVDAVMAATGCSSNLAVCAATTTLAACVQGHTRVICDATGRSKPLTLWFIVVAPAAGGKGTVFEHFMRPLLAHQREAREQAHQREIARRARLGVSRATARRLANIQSPTDEQQHQLRQLLRDIESSEPVQVPTWVATDINPSNYPKLLAMQHKARGVAAIAALDSEEEFPANYMGRHQKHVQAGPLNHGYEGEPLDQVRSSRVSDALQMTTVDAAHITLGLMLQSHWLDKLRAATELAENGFISRAIVAISPPCRPPIPPVPIPDAVRAAWDGLVGRLLTGTLPPTVELDEIAQRAVSVMFAEQTSGEDWSPKRVRASDQLARLLGLMAVVEHVSRETDAQVSALSALSALSGVVACARAPAQMVKDLASYLIPSESLAISGLDTPALPPDGGPLRLLARLADSADTADTWSVRELQRLLTTGRFRPNSEQVKSWADDLCRWDYGSPVELSSKERRNRTVRYEWHLERGSVPGTEPERASAPVIPLRALPEPAAPLPTPDDWSELELASVAVPDPEDDGR